MSGVYLTEQGQDTIARHVTAALMAISRWNTKIEKALTISDAVKPEHRQVHHLLWDVSLALNAQSRTQVWSAGNWYYVGQDSLNMNYGSVTLCVSWSNTRWLNGLCEWLQWHEKRTQGETAVYPVDRTGTKWTPSSFMKTQKCGFFWDQLDVLLPAASEELPSLVLAVKNGGAEHVSLEKYSTLYDDVISVLANRLLDRAPWRVVQQLRKQHYRFAEALLTPVPELQAKLAEALSVHEAAHAAVTELIKREARESAQRLFEAKFDAFYSTP